MTRPSWLGRAVTNRHRHAIEQASRRWRGGRTSRKILISTQVGSQAVVTKDVPPGMTVVGLNKLLDPHIDAKREKVVKKRTETWQYEVDTYDGYSI